MNKSTLTTLAAAAALGGLDDFGRGSPSEASGIADMREDMLRSSRRPIIVKRRKANKDKKKKRKQSQKSKRKNRK